MRRTFTAFTSIVLGIVFIGLGIVSIIQVSFFRESDHNNQSLLSEIALLENTITYETLPNSLSEYYELVSIFDNSVLVDLDYINSTLLDLESNGIALFMRPNL